VSSGCAFCRILGGELPHHIIDEDALWIAILDIAPAMPGHTLLIPRVHVEHLWDLESDVAAALGIGLRRVAHRIESRLAPAGLTVFQANRAPGWQSVPHVHFHLVPRELDDPLVPSWTERSGDPEAIAAVAQHLRR
jgi:histidine triad (HIT) family protein